jgi:Xaa-Pro aminopeptidase
MFKASVYTKRRERLKEQIGSGIALFPGNVDAAFNYPANPYHFRQDSNFLYFFGLDHAGMAGIVDADTGEDWIFANDIDIEDIIWMGQLPTVRELAAGAGIVNTAPYSKLADYIMGALDKGRKIHYLPTYRGETVIELSSLLGLANAAVKPGASVDLIKAVVEQRAVKDENEIAEIEKAVDVAYLMHTTAMKMAMPGVSEQEIAGTIEGISMARGGPVSFPIILSINGQILHNHDHGNILQEGRMMVTDAGAETSMHYASDITRTVPVGGVFNKRQRPVYQAVLDALVKATAVLKPGLPFRDAHFLAAETVAYGLKEIGLMKGDIKEAVANGAHTLFFPHGLGHMMGMDVHDMEGLGENYVGYDDEIKRSDQFGTAYLRMGRRLQAGFVMTVEPGCYFIPPLIDQWKAEGKNKEFINYDLVETYKDFGGIRIEDDVLITADGHRLLGTPIPKTIEDIEATMRS